MTCAPTNDDPHSRTGPTCGSRARTIILAAGCLVGAGCSTEPLEPVFVDAGEVHIAGLVVTLEVSATEVAPDEMFQVRYRVTNMTDREARLETGSSCLVSLLILHAGQRVFLEGSETGCFQAFTTHRIPPGESVDQSWDLRATIMRSPAPAGAYRFIGASHAWNLEIPEVEALVDVR